MDAVLVIYLTPINYLCSIPTYKEDQHTIELHFYDDRDDILSAIYEFFNKKTDLIPQNMTLNLHRYKSENHAVINKITGTGQTDLRYYWSLRYMASQFASFENEANDKDIIKETFDIKNTNDLKEYHQNDPYFKVGYHQEIDIAELHQKDFLDTHKEIIAKMDEEPHFHSQAAYITWNELIQDNYVDSKYLRKSYAFYFSTELNRSILLDLQDYKSIDDHEKKIVSELITSLNNDDPIVLSEKIHLAMDKERERLWATSCKSSFFKDPKNLMDMLSSISQKLINAQQTYQVNAAKKTQEPETVGTPYTMYDS